MTKKKNRLLREKRMILAPSMILHLSRIVLFTILFVLILYGLLFFLPGDKPRYYPNHSYNNTGPYGQSMLKTHLQENYELKDNLVSLVNIQFNPSAVILIINPVLSYTENEIIHLKRLYELGQPIIILGYSSATKQLLNQFNYTFGLEILDYNNKEPYYVPGINVNSSSTYYYFFRPTPVYPDSSLIQPSEPIMLFGVSTNSSTLNNDPVLFPIINKEKHRNLVIGGDAWSFSNFMLQQFPQNFQVMDTILSFFKGVKQVILEESAYAWHPTNKQSTESFLVSLFLRRNYGSTFLIWIFIPLVILLMILISPKEKDLGIKKKLAKRLADLHLTGTLVYPLTEEEQFLTSFDKVKSLHQRGFYVFIARELKHELQAREIYDHLPSPLKTDLTYITQRLVNEDQAWQVIENALIIFKIFLDYPKPDAIKIIKEQFPLLYKNHDTTE